MRDFCIVRELRDVQGVEHGGDVGARRRREVNTAISRVVGMGRDSGARREVAAIVRPLADVR